VIMMPCASLRPISVKGIVVSLTWGGGASNVQKRRNCPKCRRWRMEIYRRITGEKATRAVELIKYVIDI
jgi:hypothetical protein